MSGCCEKMMRSDDFWDGAFLDMGIERGVWDAAPSRTLRIYHPFFHHHLYKFSTLTIKVKFVLNFTPFLFTA